MGDIDVKGASHEELLKAKRIIRLFTRKFVQYMKTAIEENIKLAENSDYVPVGEKAKWVARGIDAASLVVGLIPIPAAGELARKAVALGGRKATEKFSHNVGFKKAQVVADFFPEFEEYFEEKLKKILIDFAFEIVMSFNIQFCVVIDWTKGGEGEILSKLADEAVSRIFCFLRAEKNKERRQIDSAEQLTAALLNGKNPSPSEIVKRSVRHSLTFQTGKSGLTTSDIFKRPGIYHKGKVLMRKKYGDDDKQSRMYHRYLLPGEELESHKDVGEQVKITVSDLYQELSDQREELLQDLYSRFREKSEHIEETIDDLVTAVENVQNHVVESEETVKSVKSALERVNNQVAVLGQAVVESGDISTKTITFAALQYNVKFKAELENYTQFDLHPSRTEIISGKISDPPTAIKRGGKNGVVGHKTGGACRGCVGTMGWDIDKLRKKLVLMYSIPFDQNLYSNWIGVGIFDLSDSGDKFAKMYYQPQESFKRKAFYTDVTPVVYDGDSDFCVEATCGTTHQPTINLKLHPKNQAMASPS